jgi:hypothetical protein
MKQQKPKSTRFLSEPVLSPQCYAVRTQLERVANLKCNRERIEYGLAIITTFGD